MKRSLISKALLVATLAACLSVPSASAAGRRTPSKARISNPAAAAFLWFWNSVTGFLAKAGCGLDPNGLCSDSTSPASSPSDAGCGIDPNGLCGTTPSGPASQDAGCGIDPNGLLCPSGG
jgi:hypothetical protein